MNFFVVGAQKSATTWLYNAIGNQSFLLKFPVKEFHFWDSLETDFSINKRLPHKRLVSRIQSAFFWRTLLKAFQKEGFTWFSIKFHIHYLFRTYSINWYVGFKTLSRNKLIGDFTPAYSFLRRETVAKMQATFPNAKVFFVMRDPIDRLWSQWRMHVRDNFNELSYSNVVLDIGAFMIFFQNEGLNKRCDYHTTIVNYSHFFKDQFFIGYYDDILTDPQGFLKEMCGLLSAQSCYDYAEELPLRSNESFHCHIPQTILDFLKEQLHRQYSWLAESFGGHASSWYFQRYGLPCGSERTGSSHYFFTPVDVLH